MNTATTPAQGQATAKPAPKMSIKEKYALLTRDLGWETTYQPMDAVFPQDRFEGIVIHDWDG